jgi:hypothetical protein
MKAQEFSIISALLTPATSEETDSTIAVCSAVDGKLVGIAVGWKVGFPVGWDDG